jgi:hypothetical protein
MAVADQNLEIMRGDDERLLAVITPFTAAASLHFMAKKRLGDADAAAIITKSLGSGITVTVPGDVNTPAQAQIAINKADSQVLPNKDQTLYYNLTDGANHTLAKGKLTVKPEVRLAG